MVNPKTGDTVLTDWPVNDPMEKGDYGGIRGWTFKGRPGRRMHDNGDCLGLGSIVCWLLGVSRAGDEYSESYHQLTASLITYTARLSLSGEFVPERRVLSKLAVQLVKLTVPQHVGTCKELRLPVAWLRRKW